MADENNAQFGVEIPPVKGIQEAIKDFDKLTESVTRLGNAVTGLGNKLQNVKPGGPASDMQKMQGAASQLLMTMGPLGQQAALLQQRFSGMGAAIGGLGGMSAGAVIGIGLAVAALLTLAAAAMAVKKAFDIMTEAVKAAAKFQQTADLFGDVIGNAKQAGAELEKLKKLWHEAGVFKLDDLVETATRMKSLGADTSHLTELTEAMAKAAKAGTGDIKGMTEAFASLMTGRIRGAPSIDQLTLIRALAVTTKGPMETLDQAVARTTLSIKKHEVATEDMAKAIIKAGQAGGIFATQIEDEQHMFEGASKVMGQRWDEFLLALGTPIMDELTPILLRWADILDLLIPQGEQWGQGIAALIGHIDNFVTSLDSLIGKLEKIKGLLPALSFVPFIGPAIRAAQFAHDITQPELGPGGIPKPAGIDRLVRPGPMPGKIGDWIKTFEDKGGGGESDFEKYKADLQLMNDYWQEYGIIQAKATTATEAQFRSMEAIQKLIPTLGDPLAHMAELMKGLGPSDAALVKWQILDTVAQRTLKHIEDRAKANQATMGEVWQAGLKKMTDAWGSFETQIINGIGEIGNSLVQDISGGLVDILNGTKSVKDGFRDMALSIVQDIERIIIKMLVQLAIQQLISAFGGGSGTVSMVGGTGTYSGQAGFAAGPVTKGIAVGQTGGMVGGTGRGDKVPAMLEPGEFVIPRDAAAKVGYGNLEQIRRMQAGGEVRRMWEGGTFWEGNIPDLSGADLRMTTYGPGSPNPTSADLRERIGIGNLTLQAGDAALTRATAAAYGLHAGDYFRYNGTVYRYADRPAGKVGNVLDVYYPKGGAGKPTGGGGPGDRGPGGRHYGDTGFRRIESRLLEFRPEDYGGGPIGGGDYGPRLPFGQQGIDRATFDMGILTGLNYRDQQALLNAAYFNVYGKSMDEIGNDPNARNVVLHSQALREIVAAEKAGGRTGGRDVPGGGTGRGFSPTGQVSRGREFYSGDFGRGLPSGEAGRGPGDYRNPYGFSSSGSPGSRGIAGMPSYFGHTVTNFATAIGLDTLGRGGGPANLSVIGGGIAPGQLRRIYKGIYTTPGSYGNLTYGIGPLGKLTGTGLSTYQQMHSGQMELHDLLVSNPSLMTARTSGAITRGVPMRKTFHEGGVVDTWAEYQSGGTVKRGEGVFTPEQMASLGPAGTSQVNQITIAINNQGGRTDAHAEGSGLNDKDAREMARAMLAVCKAQIEKEKRSGGSLYLSRSQRGG